MKHKQSKLLFLVFILFIWSACEDDNAVDQSTDQAPIITGGTFTVTESIDDVTTIGTVEASDPNGDALSFAILQNSDDLFEITANGGVITLATGQSLDFETSPLHLLVVEVTDGLNPVSSTITIIVLDEEENSPPEITAGQTFNASEIIRDSDQIGVVQAIDSDNDILSYSIIEDVSNLFEITSDEGVISLQEGKRLDFSAATSHTITIQVSDEIAATTATITISVTDVDDNAFITIWTRGADDRVELPLYLSTLATTTNYDFTIDWGDGTTGEVTSFNDPDASHTYDDDNEYVVVITGTLEGFNFNENGTSSFDIKDVVQWGSVRFGNDGHVFSNCPNLNVSAKDAPDLSGITNMNRFFNGAVSFDGQIGNWDVSNVTDMSEMFLSAQSFNQDINSWDVSNVEDMSRMFEGAYSFDENIGSWNVSNVTDMSQMFYIGDGGDTPLVFNQNISNWNVGKVTTMAQMFGGTSAFNQDISSWNVAMVQNMSSMFEEAFAFNQDISGWDVREVISMALMFSNAIAFDQDLSGWDTSSVNSCNSFTSINTPINGTNKVPTIGPCFGI